MSAHFVNFDPATQIETAVGHRVRLIMCNGEYIEITAYKDSVQVRTFPDQLVIRPIIGNVVEIR